MIVSYVLNLKSWIKLIYNKITYTYCVTNEFDQLLRLKTWETRLFKMPRLKTPRLETRRSQMRHFEKPRFPCFELQKLD